MGNNNIFNHLHLHSEYSMRDSVCSIKNIVSKAKEQGSTAVALTDHGNMHGCIEFYKECKKQGINPILGCEMYVVESVEMLEIPEHKHDKYHIIFLAKDSVGYHQIADCVTRGQLLKDKKTYPRTTHKDIEEIFVGGHVICLSGCVNGEIAQYLSKDDFDKARQTAQFYRGIFGEDYYFELQDHNLLIEMEYFNKLIDLGHEMNIPFVATNDAHYVNKNDKHIREMVVAMKFGQVLSEIKEDCGELYMKDYDEMYQMFYQWPESIENTVKISDKCHIDGILVEGVVKQDNDEEKGTITYTITDVPESLDFDSVSKDIKILLKECGVQKFEILDKTSQNKGFSKYELSFEMKECGESVEKTSKHIKEELGKIVHVKHFPKFKIPDGFKDEKEYIYHLTYQSLEEKYPKSNYTEDELNDIKDRIAYELGVICDLHYDGYLLIVQDFINAGKKMGMIGPGRGSAVGSIVCYLLGITSVDPLPYNLIFERFLNKDRVSDPDIDTDFAPMIRDLVIDYVKDIYGEDSVCQIITFGTLGARASIRNAGRVHGLPINFCDKIAKMIPNTPGITLDDAINGNEKKEIAPVVELLNEMKQDKDVKFLISEAKLIEGLVVQTGVHAAGVIIADTNVAKYCPMFYDVDKNAWITQFEKNSCEHDVGLLKMDFLGLENLNIISRTLKDIEKNYGITLTTDDISLTNEEEMSIVLKEIFEKGQTKGVFQFESDGMVNYLKKIKPKKLEDLILLNAAYRPGPMQYIDSIIEIRNGRKQESYICDAMRNILHVTFSKPIYQEQIQQIFHDVAGFTLGEADIIRRAMAKKKLKELEKYFPLFKQRLLEQNVPQADIDNFCNELIDFAKYAFNKSHATAYTVVAYQTAWLKHFYPVEYMANLLTSATVKTLPIYINECKTMGIEVLPPDINISGLNFTPTKDKSIRFGLKIKNSGSTPIDIVEEREENGEFKSVIDFVNRMVNRGSRAVHSNILNAYIMSGAFDSFGYNRHQLVNGMVKYVSIVKDIKKANDEREELNEIVDRSNNVLENTYPKYQSYLSKDDLGVYAKKYHKAYLSCQEAMDNNDLASAEKYRYEYEQAFPSLISMSLGISIDELQNDLLEYGKAYEDLQRAKKTITTREFNISTKTANIDQCINKDMPEYDRNYILEMERDILGFYASGHPLDSYKNYIERKASVLIGNIDFSFLKQRVILVGRIKDFAKIYTKKDNKEMCAFTLEDLTGELKVVCFADKYFYYKEYLNEGEFVILSGQIQDNSMGENMEDFSFTPQLYISRVEPARLSGRIYLMAKDLFEWENLKTTINQQCRGANELYVFFDDIKKFYKSSISVTDADIIRMKIPDIKIIER